MLSVNSRGEAGASIFQFQLFEYHFFPLSPPDGIHAEALQLVHAAYRRRRKGGAAAEARGGEKKTDLRWGQDLDIRRYASPKKRCSICGEPGLRKNSAFPHQQKLAYKHNVSLFLFFPILPLLLVCFLPPLYSLLLRSFSTPREASQAS
jgi:hypothetical protein